MKPGLLADLKSRACALKNETYALSPIDLIPDFVPVLGYLDDLVIIPGGIALALRLIPHEVMEEARQQASEATLDKRAGRVGAAIMALIWILAIVLSALLIRRLLRKTV